MDRVLVTGGTGFIAGACVQALLEQGYAVRATVRSRVRAEAARRRLAPEGEAADRLEFAEADLEGDAGWDAAAAGCRYVLHVASPLGVSAPKDPDDLIRPAREGARRAMRAARAAGAERVVLTSSVAAASPPPRSGDAVSDESRWTDPEARGVGAYAASKTLAEQAAWEESRSGPPLAVINPALVLGPVQAGQALGSVQVVQRLLNGSMPGYPRLGFNIVDVRDVADLHLRAMTAEGAAGERFIAAGDYLTMGEMARILREELGPEGGRIPTRSLPDAVLRLLSVFDPALRAVTPGLGRRSEFTSRKAEERLGWRPRPARDTLFDCARSLISAGLV